MLFASFRSSLAFCVHILDLIIWSVIIGKISGINHVWRILITFHCQRVESAINHKNSDFCSIQIQYLLQVNQLNLMYVHLHAATARDWLNELTAPSEGDLVSWSIASNEHVQAHSNKRLTARFASHTAYFSGRRLFVECDYKHNTILISLIYW